MSLLNPFDLYFSCMRKIEKQMLRKQADVYLYHRQKLGCDSRYEDWLSLFVNTCSKVDIADVNDEDIQRFLDKAFEVAPTPSQRILAEKVVRGFLGYYKARDKNLRTKEGKGRPAHVSEIERVKNYRKMGLKFREIERLTGHRVSLIHRWINYVLPE